MEGIVEGMGAAVDVGRRGSFEGPGGGALVSGSIGSMRNGSARDGLWRGAWDNNREEGPGLRYGPSSTRKLLMFREYGWCLWRRRKLKSPPRGRMNASPPTTPPMIGAWLMDLEEFGMAEVSVLAGDAEPTVLNAT